MYEDWRCRNEQEGYRLHAAQRTCPLRDQCPRLWYLFGRRNRQVLQALLLSVRVAQYGDSQSEVKAELTLPIDPAATQRAIDAEVDKAIEGARSEAKEYDRK